MSLFETMKADRIQAMKDIDPIKKDLLSCVIADASKETKTPDDAKMIATIKRFIKTCNENQATWSGNSAYSNHSYTAHIEELILEGYLPKQLDTSEIKRMIVQNDFQNIGTCQKWFKENYSGQYDGKIVADVFKELK